MENSQVKKLKITVTNIKSSLLHSNKELIRLKKEKVKLFSTQQTQLKISKKEKSIESTSSFRQSVANIGQKLISGPLSLIDKFKEFFGLILLGILVNNLPTIIKKFQEVFGKIKAFLDGNPWIMDAVKFGFKIIGEGIMGLAKVIKFVRPYIGGSFKFALDTIRSTKNQIGSLITTFDELDLAFGSLIRDLNMDKIPDPNKDAAKYSSFVAGGGKAALKDKSQTVDEVIEQGKKNISGYDTRPRQLTPVPQLPAPGSMYPANPPAQKLARGGTIGNIPPSEGTGRGGPSDVSKTAPYLLGTSRTPFARPGGTAIGRKTIEKANAFKIFKRNVEDQKSDQKDQKKNYNLMEELLIKFKELQKLREKEKPNGGPGPGPGPGLGGGGAEVFEGQGAGRVWNFFKGKGLSDIAVAGIMGNAQQESGFNPTISHSESLQGSPAKFIGIFQWDNNRSGDRWGRLVKWARKNNYDPESIDTQLKWTWEELSGPEALSLREIKKAQSPEEAAEIWYSKYERASHGLSNRQNYARQFYTIYKGKLPTAITNLSQSKLPALPPTNTLAGQEYGASRDAGARKHAGVDFDISGNEKFYSRIGGEVLRAGFRYGDDGYGVDIYNPRINMTERIAEGRQVLVKKGETVRPGQAVVQGESNTGVIHYELRKGKSGPSGSFEGTVNPINFLKDLGASPSTGPVKPENLSPLTNITNIMKKLNNTVELSIKQPNGSIINYKLEIDGDKVKFYTKNKVLGLFDEEIDVTKKNTKFLENILNELKFKTKKSAEPGTASASITPLQQRGIQVTPRSSELASAATYPQRSEAITNTVVLTKTRYIVQPVIT